MYHIKYDPFENDGKNQLERIGIMIQFLVDINRRKREPVKCGARIYAIAERTVFDEHCVLDKTLDKFSAVVNGNTQIHFKLHEWSGCQIKNGALVCEHD